MRRMPFVVALLVLASLGMGNQSGCDQSTTGPSTTSTPTTSARPSHDPMRIVASWNGGRTGSPLNSSADPTPQYFGRLCPANSVVLLNRSEGFNGLTIRNTCTIQVTYALCTAAGSDIGGVEGVPACASPDPFATARLFLVTLPENGGFTHINASPSFTLNVFFCSDQTVIAPAGSFSSKIKCVG